MRDELLEFYERELGYLRRAGEEFAGRYPKIASRLLLEPNKCDDPHVERLLEGAAFLAARIHLKLADDFPQITEALLGILYPQYLRPVPSMSVVRFELDPEQGKLAEGLRLPKGTQLLTDPTQGEGIRFRFRTAYDTSLWPVSVVAAEWASPQNLDPSIRTDRVADVIRLELACDGELEFSELGIDRLRIYLNAEEGPASTLYELLANNCVAVFLRDPDGNRPPIRLPASALTPVGFGPEEGVLPYERRTLLAYRLLQEYFAFPQKFFFFDLAGVETLAAGGFAKRAEVLFLLRSFERAERREYLRTTVNADTFRLNCSPVVNLFERSSEPIWVDRRSHEYPILPEAGRSSAAHVFSVDTVEGTDGRTQERLPLRRLHSFGQAEEKASVYWYASRRIRPGGGGETEVVLSFADRSGRAALPEHDQVWAQLTCHNGDQPALMPFGRTGRSDFQVPGGLPIRRAMALMKPTKVTSAPVGSPLLWKLVSHLGVNYMSLVDGGPEALRDLLRLHDAAQSTVGERRIAALLDVRTSPTYARIEREHGLSFARGHRVEIEFDEEAFAGGGVYLLASVIERFLGMYVSMNSFCALTVRTPQRDEPLAEWPPRSGWKPLL